MSEYEWLFSALLSLGLWIAFDVREARKELAKLQKAVDGMDKQGFR